MLFVRTRVRRLFRLARQHDEAAELAAVFATCVYGHQRELVERVLTTPIVSFLADERSAEVLVTWRPRQVAKEVVAKMTRDALRALLSCAEIPADAIVCHVPVGRGEYLMDLLRALLVCEEEALDALPGPPIDYSPVPAEALAQLVVAWGNDLEIEDPKFRGVVGLSGMVETWRGLQQHMFSGFLEGTNRVPLDAIRRKAMDVIADMPSKQAELSLRMFRTRLGIE